MWRVGKRIGFIMSDRTHLSSILNQINGVRVIVVGDIMLDSFINGDVDRISPEAPIPVLRIRSETAMLGGAGNVVRNIVALGASVDFISALGDDKAGLQIAELLSAETTSEDQHMNMVRADLIKVPSRETAIKTRYIAATQQILRTDKETVADLDEATQNRLIELVDNRLKESSILILSDYAKGVLPVAVIKALIAAAKSHHCFVIVDPKGSDYNRYCGADLITPNRAELLEASQLPVNTDDDVITAATYLIKNFSLGAVLATRSADGMTLVNNKAQVSHLKAEALEVFDVSGAGDTVVATIATALAAGAELPIAAELANIAAGIVVAKTGTATASHSEVTACVHHQDISDAEAKVLDQDHALARVQDWQRRGFKVGFTNGCFDLLHPGHVSLLKQAAIHCDRLIVGLNDDASIRRLKGETRPVQSESSRATVLASLGMVDMVILFSGDTPLGLIQLLKPQILVKGADYSVAQVVGADIVQSYGGQVILATLEAGHSTTDTIRRIGHDDDLRP